MKLIFAYLTYIIFTLFGFHRVWNVKAIKLDFGSFGSSSQEIINNGKTQYQALRERETNPKFGVCWRNAIQYLESSCRLLTEESQKMMALRFTDCFLEMSGHEKYECYFTKNVDKSTLAKNEKNFKFTQVTNCIQSMPDRAFNVYSQFYTQTQNICFFLQSQLWHERTGKTIDRLQASSVDVQTKLEESGQLQQELIVQQKRSIHVQNELLKHGLHLKTTLADSQKRLDGILEDFKSSTNEQTRVILLIFEKLHYFQSWVMSEITWIDTVIFYVLISLTTFVLTSNERTKNARIFIFILFLINMALESFIPKLLNVVSTNLNAAQVKENIDAMIWIVRKFTVLASAGIYFYVYATFQDYNHINYQLLLRIKQQNDDILNQSTRIAGSILNVSNISNDSFYVNENSKIHNSSYVMPRNDCENKYSVKLVQDKIDEVDSTMPTMSSCAVFSPAALENSVQQKTDTFELKENRPRSTRYNLRRHEILR